MKPLLPIIWLGLLSACTSLPSTITQPPAPDLDFAQALADPTPHLGQFARWGGVIVAVENTPSGALIEIAHLPLGSHGRPREQQVQNSLGRFVATTDAFIDPVLYGVQQMITVFGAVAPSQTRQVDERMLRMPHLEIHTLYVWPQKQAFEPVYPQDPRLNPWHYRPYGAWPYPYGAYRY